MAIRDMVNKLQAYMIPTGAREEVELSAGAEMHNERTPWAAESCPWRLNSGHCDVFLRFGVCQHPRVTPQ